MKYNNSSFSKLACNFLFLFQHLAGHTPWAALWCFKYWAGPWMPEILWYLSHFQLHIDAHTVNFIFRWPRPGVLVCVALQTSDSRGEPRFPCWPLMFSWGQRWEGRHVTWLYCTMPLCYRTGFVCAWQGLAHCSSVAFCSPFTWAPLQGLLSW